VRNQGALGSCVAFGVTSVLEYHTIKINGGPYTRLSERALYKSMLFLMQVTGDTGGYVRVGMGAAKALGIPPAKYWPYDVANFDVAIPAEVQNLGENFSGITYFRHDGGTNTPPECALAVAKKYLAGGFPFVFAFYGFDSFDDDGKIPLPGPGESAQWGHCIAGFGYDDDIVIPTGDGKSSTKGAIKFRNSWGSSWGMKGYGYLPYEYFLRRYASDMWTVLDAKWIDTGLYGF
jgi:C1A family cysteine protease